MIGVSEGSSGSVRWFGCGVVGWLFILIWTLGSLANFFFNSAFVLLLSLFYWFHFLDLILFFFSVVKEGMVKVWGCAEGVDVMIDHSQITIQFMVNWILNSSSPWMIHDPWCSIRDCLILHRVRVCLDPRCIYTMLFINLLLLLYWFTFYLIFNVSMLSFTSWLSTILSFISDYLYFDGTCKGHQAARRLLPSPIMGYGRSGIVWSSSSFLVCPP